MKLYLVQHGEAKTKDESPDRPLNGERYGRRKRSFACETPSSSLKTFITFNDKK